MKRSITSCLGTDSTVFPPRRHLGGSQYVRYQESGRSRVFEVRIYFGGMGLFTDGLCCFVTILGVSPRTTLAIRSVSRGFARVCSSGEAMRSMASYGDADRSGPQQGGSGAAGPRMGVLGRRRNGGNPAVLRLFGLYVPLCCLSSKVRNTATAEFRPPAGFRSRREKRRRQGVTAPESTSDLR